jgi:DNA polymerase
MATKKSSRPTPPGAAAYLPHKLSMSALTAAVQHCQGCDIYRNATQAVFGEMDTSAPGHDVMNAKMLMIGEQPGDREDKEGHPFVGPAGKLLDRCLEEAGIERRQVYVTNAVKHFKWEPRGKLRIHKKPSTSEIFACRPWLDAEIALVHPKLIVCLGAVAAQSLLGSKFKVTVAHGHIQSIEGLPPILATFHPASILRTLDENDRQRQTRELVADLRTAYQQVRNL